VVGAEEQDATRAALLESGAAALAAQSLSAAGQTLEPDRFAMAKVQLRAALVQEMAA